MVSKIVSLVGLVMVGLATAAPQYSYEPPEAPSSLYEKPQEPEQLYEAPSDNNLLVAEPQNIVPNVVSPPSPAMEGMPYDFTWGVEDQDTDNTFSHVENSDGQTTQGEYRVLLPDGRTQVVTFFDKGEGFNAEVTYE